MPTLQNPETLFSFDEFIAGAERTDFFQQVAANLAEEERETIFSESIVRRDEEWGVLANQVVGRENF
jgi:hypothetical protein